MHYLARSMTHFQHSHYTTRYLISGFAAAHALILSHHSTQSEVFFVWGEKNWGALASAARERLMGLKICFMIHKYFSPLAGQLNKSFFDSVEDSRRVFISYTAHRGCFHQKKQKTKFIYTRDDKICKYASSGDFCLVEFAEYKTLVNCLIEWSEMIWNGIQ